MSFEIAKAHLDKFGFGDRVKEYEESSATVELAAHAAGVEPARIAKTLSFIAGDGCILVVTAGDKKIDNAKFKAKFGFKAKMLSLENVEAQTGFRAGGVCPFGVNASVPVYLDISMQRFDIIYPACGSSNSSVKLSCDELFTASLAKEWVDVCK